MSLCDQRWKKSSKKSRKTVGKKGGKQVEEKVEKKVGKRENMRKISMVLTGLRCGPVSFSFPKWHTLGTRGFSRVRWEFSVLAEGRHVFGPRPKPRAAKPREKPLARSGAFYRPRWPLSFFIGLHLRQSDWKSPTVIMWAGTWRNVQRPTLSLERQVRV